MFLAVTFLYTESPIDPIKDGHFHTCTLQRTGVKLGGSHRISAVAPILLPHNWDPAPFSAQFIFEYFSLCVIFCKKNVVLHRHFVICICPCLVWIDVASVKHYLNATKTKESALNAWKPFVPSSLAPIGIHHLLLSNLTTGKEYSQYNFPSNSWLSFQQKCHLLWGYHFHLSTAIVVQIILWFLFIPCMCAYSPKRRQPLCLAQ